MNLRYLVAILIFGTTAACAEDQASPMAPADGVGPVTLIINFEASDAGHVEFDAIMAGVSDAMASEPGFVSAVVYQNIDDPKRYVLQEVWTTKELHGAHYDRIVASGDWAHIKSLLTTEPVMGYYATPAAN